MVSWRPDIRAAVISRTRINLHRKIVKHAAFTGQYPVAVLSDCVVYAADGISPLDFLPSSGVGITWVVVGGAGAAAQQKP
ncbi:hypothetical protein AB0D24_13780 [Streptomyces javensis]|uniref:hypothetical protein n=1 Tax=Streptomyces javensis TaxID=114698 RepID=UPI0033C73AC0